MAPAIVATPKQSRARSVLVPLTNSSSNIPSSQMKGPNIRTFNAPPKQTIDNDIGTTHTTTTSTTTNTTNTTKMHETYDNNENHLQFSRSSVGGSKYLVNAHTNVTPEGCDLIFESRFESGNLAKAIKITPVYYELYLRPDLYTNKHTQWFYFRVTNTRKNVPYRLVYCVRVHCNCTSNIAIELFGHLSPKTTKLVQSAF